MTCDWCGEEVKVTQEDHRLVTVMDTKGIHQRPRHRDCDVRAVAGSLGHQLGLCQCRGGPGVLDDPPGLSRRGAARLAALLFLEGPAEGRNPGGRLSDPEK